MVKGRKASDSNPRQTKKARLPQFRAARSRNDTAQGSTSSAISLQRSNAGKLQTQERERQRPILPPEEQPPEEPPLDSEEPMALEEPLPGPQARNSPSLASADARPKLKRKRINTTRSRLLEWLNLRDSCLDELLRHDGPSNAPSLCGNCSTMDGLFRCRDCGHGRTMLCDECMVEKHAELELHQIQRWNGRFFEKAPLCDLGLRVQLGHDGGHCSYPVPGPQNFLVFDVSGVHQVNIDYCGCQPAYELDKRMQHLRKRWFPATTAHPQTVFTFDCLDTFHELTLQGKMNLYDFYHVLLRRTDNANVLPSIYRYPEMHRAFRLWRNLMAFKRAGRGHDPSGIDGTPPGGLMVECPACPHPDRNLPDDWQNAGPLAYLYILYLAIDANFKLKGKDRKITDIELAPGLGAFVNETQYQDFIKEYVDQPEINTCDSEHDAIVRASIRKTPGYAVTGAGLVICSRHVMVRGNGAGDLQKGEKYCNMDYIALSAVIAICLLWVIFTYDIGCQWSKNLKSRMEDFPETMRINESTKVDVAIPSWHIKGHGPNCQDNYNLAYKKGVGRTCGDEIEGSWSHTNPLAASVREMGPGARHETLNDHWNGWNFRKVVGLRRSLRKKFTEASAMKEIHERTYAQLTATFSANIIKQWEKMIEIWENNPKSENPYTEPSVEITLQDVRLELVKEEAGDGLSESRQKHKVSMSGFLTKGLELEERQYQLRLEFLETKAKTSKQKADVQEKRNTLQREIMNWRQVQLAYTPHAAIAIAQTLPQADDAHVDFPENMSLHLPSSLPEPVRFLSEMKQVCNMERRLRYAQAHDALAQIRRQRRIIQGLWQFKKINVSGTGNRPNTRILSTYTKLTRKVTRAAQKYRTAHSALRILDPHGDWQGELKELQKEDIRGPGRDPEESNGRYVVSWIWLTRRADRATVATEAEFNECMRVEWSKVRARMMRWQEEYMIIQEEMQRVVAWFEWKAAWWVEQASRRRDAKPTILGGISAYAYKQADLTQGMAVRCAADWLPVLRGRQITPGWGTNYLPRKDSQRGDTGKNPEQDDDEEALASDDGLDIEETPSDVEDSDSEFQDQGDSIFDYDD